MENTNKIAFKTGIWEVVENEGIIGRDKSNPEDIYEIYNDRLWETRDLGGTLVWDWLIHLTEKKWITSENINDLNTAFFFAQDFFKSLKPKNLPDVSTSLTLICQYASMGLNK